MVYSILQNIVISNMFLANPEGIFSTDVQNLNIEKTGNYKY